MGFFFGQVPGRLIAVSGLLVSLGSLVLAQQPNSEIKDLYSKYQSGRGAVNRWMSGNTPFDAAKKEDLDLLANYCRFITKGQTFHDRLTTTSDINSKLLIDLPENVQKDITQTMVRSFDSPHGPALLKAYQRTMLEQAEAVLTESKDQYVRLNVSRVLPGIGMAVGSLKRDGKAVLDLKDQVEVYNRQIVACTKLVVAATQGTHRDDAVLLYALRGAKEAMVGFNQTFPLRTDREKKGFVPPDATQEEKLLGIAANLAEKPPAWANGASPEELEGYRMIRREAIRVLAAAGRSKVGAVSPATVLGRILALDPTKSSYRLDELVDAAIGLATIRPDPTYNTDLAASLVGKTIQEFIATYTQKQGIYASFPFVYHAARLNTALIFWEEKPPSPEIKALVTKARAALTALEKKQEPQFQETEAIQKLRDKSYEMIKGDKSSEIPPAQ
jgi:hypothetical protein